MMMFHSVCAVFVMLILAAASLPLTQVEEVKAWHEGIMKNADVCASENNVDPDEFKKTKTADKKYACVYKCLVVKADVMSESGKFKFPSFVSHRGRQCVEKNAGPTKDPCDKAYEAQLCWEKAKKALKALLAI